MNEEKDTYKTLSTRSKEVLFKDRGSKFYGYAYPIYSENEAKDLIDLLKKEHYNARHWCYAWQLGKNYSSFRANDDGEPSNTAGMPIYGQLKSFALTNILVVVVRYFGGTKLGISGLIQAYKKAAKMTLESSKIVEKTIDEFFLLKFEYPEMNTVMRIIKDEKLNITSQKLEIACEITFSVRKKEAPRIFDIFKNTYLVFIKRIEDN